VTESNLLTYYFPDFLLTDLPLTTKNWQVIEPFDKLRVTESNLLT